MQKPWSYSTFSFLFFFFFLSTATRHSTPSFMHPVFYLCFFFSCSLKPFCMWTFPLTTQYFFLFFPAFFTLLVDDVDICTLHMSVDWWSLFKTIFHLNVEFFTLKFYFIQLQYQIPKMILFKLCWVISYFTFIKSCEMSFWVKS